MTVNTFYMRKLAFAHMGYALVWQRGSDHRAR
jgi:hypothetical protein